MIVAIGTRNVSKTTTEMIIGAKNRALNAFEHAKMVKRHM